MVVFRRHGYRKILIKTGCNSLKVSAERILINSHSWPSVPKAGDLRPHLGFLVLLSRRQAPRHVARPGRIWSQQGWGRVPASGSTTSPARKAWSCSLTWDHPWEGSRQVTGASPGYMDFLPLTHIVLCGPVLSQIVKPINLGQRLPQPPRQGWIRSTQ